MKQGSSEFNSVEKAMQVLLAFSAERPEWGVRGLSARLGFSPATVQRLLQTLKSRGFVDQSPETRQYRLGHVYYRFLNALQSTLPFTRAAPPIMQQLLSDTRETVYLNVIDGMERLCVDTLESLQDLKVSMPIGSRSPLYAGASSKCLLAFAVETFQRTYLETVTLRPITAATIVDKTHLQREMRTIQQTGFAESLGERNPGLGSLSVPIFNHRGSSLAALSLAIPEMRFKTKDHRDFCLAHLRRAGQTLSRQLGYAG